MEPVLWMLGSGLAAWVATGLLIRNATALGLVQLPIARSAHSRPTPTGGGIAIVLGSSVTGLWAAWLTGTTLWAVIAASLAVALLGLADDRRDLSARARLMVQFLVVLVLIYAIRPLPPLDIAGLPFSSALFAAFVMLAGLWWTNLFNFMDGLDGLAASEAIFILIAAAALAGFPGGADTFDPLWWWMIAAAASTAGFLLYNRPPARIFMGDTGSNYLAVLIFAFALLTVSAGMLSYWTWCVLVSLFVSDASVTLLRRIVRRVDLSEGHREHAYQRLSRRWRGHLPVTSAYAAVDLLWVLPFAVSTTLYPGLASLLCAAAYVPLLAAMWVIGAGRPETS